MPSPTIPNKIAFIGGGQMAEAMIGGLLSGQVCLAESMWAADPVAERRDRLKSQFGIRVGPSNSEAVAWADVVVLAVKPQMFPAVLSELGPMLAHAFVISIVAGVTIRTIAEQTGSATRVVRAMPNTPALIREGMTALAPGAGVSDDDVLHQRRHAGRQRPRRSGGQPLSLQRQARQHQCRAGRQDPPHRRGAVPRHRHPGRGAPDAGAKGRGQRGVLTRKAH